MAFREQHFKFVFHLIFAAKIDNIRGVKQKFGEYNHKEDSFQNS